MKQKANDAPKEHKEHKKNWREMCATEEDIQNFLNGTLYLRMNEVSGEAEFRVPSIGEYAAMRIRYPTGRTPLDEWRDNDAWQVVDDRLVNSLCNMLSVEKVVNPNKIWQVIKSDFVQRYNPFRHYLNRLPPWTEDTNPILSLAMDVKVKGGMDEQMLFYLCLRKWLVAMVAGWLDDNVVNEKILVLVGRQGIFKTTWFEHLLPPELAGYFHSNASFGRMDKDEILKLSRYGLICCEELDTMKPTEMNRLKWAVTTKETCERKAYDHSPQRRKHIASYCGTGNNLQFIDDDTGTRRWLPFEVESIRSPREYRIRHEEIFAQAYKLYLSDFRYWFEGSEEELLCRHNHRFEVAKPELELISRFYRVPAKGEASVFVSASEIMQTIGGQLTYQLTMNKLGRAMSALGFVSMRSRGRRGYNVVAYSGADMEVNKTMMAYEAQPESETAVVTQQEIRDAFDTLL
ncbi:MAG: hypothetical protein J6M36_03125 [Prevotella sp.]|nr:hypothetical protein [Prevotella sp.]